MKLITVLLLMLMTSCYQGTKFGPGIYRYYCSPKGWQYIVIGIGNNKTMAPDFDDNGQPQRCRK